MGRLSDGQCGEKGMFVDQTCGREGDQKLKGEGYRQQVLLRIVSFTYIFREELRILNGKLQLHFGNFKLT